MKIFALALLLTCSCGPGFSIGDTTFIVEDGAEPWADLPEAVAAMQKVSTHEDTWDVTVRLYPSWYPVWNPGDACIYDHTSKTIKARTSRGPSTAEDCLPHEVAHRWDYLTRAPWTIEDVHDDVFKEKRDILNEAARNTWMHR